MGGEVGGGQVVDQNVDMTQMESVDEVVVAVEDPDQADVRALLEEHLRDMYATSPADSVHALDLTALSHSTVTFWTARAGGRLLGCGALKTLGEHHGEIKSMRTAADARGRGVGATVLGAILDEAVRRGYVRLSLETGAQDYFAPARSLYRRHGFTECPPFGQYVEDPHSVFLTRAL